MILKHIKLGTPSLWIKTDDVYRISDYIISSGLRNFYTITPDGGFSQYLDSEWKSVLIDFPTEDGESTIQKITYDFSVAYAYIREQLNSFNSTFIHVVYSDPEAFVQPFSGLFAVGAQKYRNAFFNDDNSAFPIQQIVLSTFDCPENYTSLFTILESDPLSKSEITDILHHFHSSTDGLVLNIEDSEDIIKSSLGLSEHEFINLCLTSILDVNKISSKYIYDHKMAKIKERGILEIVKPKVSFDNIGGLDLAKDLITRNVWLWNNPEEAKKFGVTPIRRLLMVGVPGTGKSAICEATANELGLDLARTGVSQVMNSFVGQSEANMRAVFRQIKAMAPLCVWIDEFGRDMSGGSSSSHVDAGTTDRVHGEFLTGLQELPDDVFLICAANQLEHLRPEMLRADRFDKIMFVGLPSFQERQDIFKIYLSNVDTSHNFDYESLSNATHGFTGAEIRSLIKEANFFVVSSELRSVTTNDILTFAPNMRNILWNKSRQMIIDLYKHAMEQWDFASSSQMEDAHAIINNSYTPTKTQRKTYTW